MFVKSKHNIYIYIYDIYTSVEAGRPPEAEVPVAVPRAAADALKLGA